MATGYSFDETTSRECSACPNFVVNLQTAKLSPCGHLYCEKCIRTIFRLDLRRANDAVGVDTNTISTLENFEVGCVKGCERKYSFNDLKSIHEDSRICPWGCGERFNGFKDHKDHLANSCINRFISCDYCEKMIVFKDLEIHVETICELVKIPCKYCDQEPLPRSQMNLHERSCVNYTRECDYNKVGCLVKGQGPFVTNHENEDVVHHLRLIFNVVVKQKEGIGLVEDKLAAYFEELQSENAKLTEALEQKDEEIAKLKKEVESLQNNPAFWKTFCWEIKNFSQVLEDAVKGNRRNYESESFFSHENGYKMRVFLKIAKTHLGLFLQVMKGPVDDFLTWPCSLRANIKLFNVRNKKEDLINIIKISPENLDCSKRPDEEANEGCGFFPFVAVEAVNNVYKTDDDRFLIKVEVSIMGKKENVNDS